MTLSWSPKTLPPFLALKRSRRRVHRGSSRAQSMCVRGLAWRAPPRGPRHRRARAQDKRRAQERKPATRSASRDKREWYACERGWQMRDFAKEPSDAPFPPRVAAPSHFWPRGALDHRRAVLRAPEPSGRAVHPWVAEAKGLSSAPPKRKASNDLNNWVLCMGLWPNHSAIQWPAHRYTCSRQRAHTKASPIGKHGSGCQTVHGDIRPTRRLGPKASGHSSKLIGDEHELGIAPLQVCEGAAPRGWMRRRSACSI